MILATNIQLLHGGTKNIPIVKILVYHQDTECKLACHFHMLWWMHPLLYQGGEQVECQTQSAALHNLVEELLKRIVQGCFVGTFWLALKLGAAFNLCTAPSSLMAIDQQSCLVLN